MNRICTKSDGTFVCFSLVLREEGSPPEKQGALEGGSAQPGGAGVRKTGRSAVAAFAVSA